MSEPTPPPSESKVQFEAAKAQRAADFKDVFGSNKVRTPAQQRVLDYLETFGDDDKNSFEFNVTKDGVAIIAAGLHRDGAKSILRVIKRNLSYAEDKKAEKPKPKAKSQR